MRGGRKNKTIAMTASAFSSILQYIFIQRNSYKNILNAIINLNLNFYFKILTVYSAVFFFLTLWVMKLTI